MGERVSIKNEPNSFINAQFGGCRRTPLEELHLLKMEEIMCMRGSLSLIVATVVSVEMLGGPVSF